MLKNYTSRILTFYNESGTPTNLMKPSESNKTLASWIKLGVQRPGPKDCCRNRNQISHKLEEGIVSTKAMKINDTEYFC